MWLIILIFIVGLIYLATMQGITCCNSGSLFALIKAIVGKKSFKINGLTKYTRYLDYAKFKGDYYSDRPPGLAFFAVPIYILGCPVTLISVISGILSTVLVYLITLKLVSIPIIAFFTGLIFAFCTINWRYSTTFIIHSLSTFFVLLSVYFLISGYPILLVGFILGIATIVEYTDFAYCFGIGLSEILFGNFYALLFLGAGYFLGIIPLLIYNKKCFGSPFTTSYKYSAHFKWSNSPKTTFVTPIFKGIFGLLFFIPKKRGQVGLPGGILTMSPILIFGIIGYFFLPFNFLVLFLCLTLPIFLFISKHKTWWGGGAEDYRYLTSMIPYLAIPVGLSMKYLPSLWPIILLLALISLIMVVSRMIILTVSIDELKKIDPEIIEKIKKRKIGLLELLRLKYLKKIISLAFEGLFIRKIKLEKEKEFKRTYNFE